MTAINKYGAIYGLFTIWDALNRDSPVKRASCSDHCYVTVQSMAICSFRAYKELRSASLSMSTELVVYFLPILDLIRRRFCIALSTFSRFQITRGLVCLAVASAC